MRSIPQYEAYLIEDKVLVFFSIKYLNEWIHRLGEFWQRQRWTWTKPPSRHSVKYQRYSWSKKGGGTPMQLLCIKTFHISLRIQWALSWRDHVRVGTRCPIRVYDSKLRAELLEKLVLKMKQVHRFIKDLSDWKRNRTYVTPSQHLGYFPTCWTYIVDAARTFWREYNYSQGSSDLNFSVKPEWRGETCLITNTGRVQFIRCTILNPIYTGLPKTDETSSNFYTCHEPDSLQNVLTTEVNCLFGSYINFLPPVLRLDTDTGALRHGLWNDQNRK